MITFGGECPPLVDLQLWTTEEDSPNNVPVDNGVNNYEGNNSMTAWMKRLGWYASEDDVNIDEEVYRITKGVPERHIHEEI